MPHSEQEREKGRKLIKKILYNILKNPFETSKSGTINLKRIENKLSNCKPALQLLFLVGFVTKTIEDKQRLVWISTQENLEQMKEVQSLLRLSLDQIDTVIFLMQDGYTSGEAIGAINLSQNHEIKERTSKS